MGPSDGTCTSGVMVIRRAEERKGGSTTEVEASAAASGAGARGLSEKLAAVFNTDFEETGAVEFEGASKDGADTLAATWSGDVGLEREVALEDKEGGAPGGKSSPRERACAEYTCGGWNERGTRVNEI